ncbi:MAG: thiamine pyrophosphate-dependent enzyme, partial [Candidatus Neomarinimicrobiota bacterium]
LHTMRRNIDLLYIVMNNQIYGLTTGQLSPTSAQGMKTKSSPDGSIEAPLNPMALAITGGATWVGRGFSGDIKHLSALMKAGMEHTGFSLLDVFSPCVTYNHDNTFAWFKERVKKLEDNGHDPRDWKAAIEQAFIWGDEIPIGLLFENVKKPALHQLDPVLDEGGPLAFRDIGVSPELGQTLVDELL